MSGDEGDSGRSTTYIVLMLTICTVSVLLNAIVIFVLVRYNGFRTSVDVFLVNLALTDITMAGLVQPTHFGTAAGPGDDFGGGSAGCKVAMFIPLVTILAAISTVVAIAIDRYRVMILRKTIPRAGALGIIGIIWFLSLAVSAPQLYEYDIYMETDDEYNTSYRSCGSEGAAEQFKTVYASIVFVIAYAIPLLTLIVCYASITRFLWQHANHLRDASNQSNPRPKASMRQPGGVSTRNVRVAKMLLSIGVTFALLWSPYFIIFAMTEVTNNDHMENLTSWPHLVSRTMTILSTVSNPTIFLAFSTQFRRAVRTALSACREGQWTCGCRNLDRSGDSSFTNPNINVSNNNAVAMETSTPYSDTESTDHTMSSLSGNLSSSTVTVITKSPV